MDSVLQEKIRNWCLKRGPMAGRTGELINDDYEALDRLLGRRSSSQERKFMKTTWDSMIKEYETQ